MNAFPNRYWENMVFPESSVPNASSFQRALCLQGSRLHWRVYCNSPVPPFKDENISYILSWKPSLGEKGVRKGKREGDEGKTNTERVNLKLIKPYFLPLHQKSLLFQCWIHFQRHADPSEGNSASYSCAVCPAVYALLAHLLSAKHPKLPSAEAVPAELCFILGAGLRQRQCLARYILK